MLGDRISAEIERQHRSVKEVAETADIHRDSLSKIIRGHQSPRRDTIERIAQALEIDIDSLLAGPEEEAEMGRAVPGGKQVPVGSSVTKVYPGRDKLEILREALAVLCTMEARGEATSEERDALTSVVARLEQA